MLIRILHPFLNRSIIIITDCWVHGYSHLIKRIISSFVLLLVFDLLTSSHFQLALMTLINKRILKKSKGFGFSLICLLRKNCCIQNTKETLKENLIAHGFLKKINIGCCLHSLLILEGCIV